LYISAGRKLPKVFVHWMEQKKELTYFQVFKNLQRFLKKGIADEIKAELRNINSA